MSKSLNQRVVDHVPRFYRHMERMDETSGEKGVGDNEKEGHDLQDARKW